MCRYQQCCFTLKEDHSTSLKQTIHSMDRECDQTVKNTFFCEAPTQNIQSMTNQNTLLRIFRLIALLESLPHRTVKQLAQLLGTNKRTVYRYLHLLEEVGLLIECDQQHRYFLFRKDGKPTDNYLFTSEEEELLRQLMFTHAPQSPLSQSLQRKLYVHSATSQLPGELLEAKNSLLVTKLGKALKNNQWAVLKNYYSANSGTISDRKVAPLRFEEHYRKLLALEEASGTEKVFKVDRIGEVHLLAQHFEGRESQLLSDPFGMSGGEWIPVTLRLSKLGAQLLREDHPLATEGISPEPERKGLYLYRGQVCDYRGIGRFVLGLPGEVEALGPVGLLTYLQEKKALPTIL